MASPDIRQLSDAVYYLPGGVNAALVVNPDNEVIFIDTGGDKEHGRKLRKACDALGAKPVAIVNTHAHADHYGGNDYLTRNFDLPVYAPPFEASIMQSPLLEPVYLFGGAKPLAELTSKWLMAKPSPVHHLLGPGGLELFGVELDIVESSGHAHTHYAVGVGEVLLAADAVFGKSALEKYPLPFGQDIGAQIASARKMATLGARVLLPGHGDPAEGAEAIAHLVERNLETFEAAANAVAEACQGQDSAGVLKRLCDTLDITMTDLPRYYLNLCTVMAYLSHLREQGKVELRLVDNSLCWFRASG